MIAIDPRPISLLSGGISAVMGLVLYGISRHYPPSIRGSREWASASLLCFASVLFYGADGVLPSLVVVVAGNGLLLAGCLLFFVGSQRFLGQASAGGGWALAIAGCLAVLVFFHEVWPDDRVRVAAFTALMATIVLRHGALLLRSGRGFASRFTALVLGAQAVVLVARGVTVWLDASTQGRFDPSSMQTLYLASYCFSGVLVSVGVVLMVGERLREEFEQLATRDGLTGTLNRRAIMEVTQAELDRSRRSGQPLALLLLDIDHFKFVNDTHGALAGDEVLRRCAAAVARCLRAPDRLGRFGGEAFMAVLPQTDPSGARQLAEQVRRAVEGLSAMPRITTSLGVAEFRGPGDTAEAMLARADRALHAAKHGGRNRVAAALNG